MGEVFLKYRVMPDGAEVDLEQLEASLRASMPDFAKVEKTEAKPFAFGLKILEAGIVVVDDEGNNDKVEEAIAAVEGVQSVELLEMGRL